MSTRPGDLLTVRTPLVNFHVLRDQDGLVLMDTGFAGGVRALNAALHSRGWEAEPIRGILLTHGHLDHIFNVAAIARDTGAWIAAPSGDVDHYAGKPVYRGWSRAAGILESIGRHLPGFATFTPDHWIGDGEIIEVWGGLRAVHLPGHTPGHTGYYCESRRLLFCGDLFASFGRWSHFPPPVLNSRPDLMAGSVAKALALDPAGVIPNHGDDAEPAVHLMRLRRLATWLPGKASPAGP